MQNDFSQLIFSLLDLTNLDEFATEQDIHLLCENAVSATNHVAAVCVYPQYVSLCKKLLAGTEVKVATVANFPSGTSSLEEVITEIQTAAQMGADEIDVVFAYQSYLAGEKDFALDLIANCKKVSNANKLLLKVILETGAFTTEKMIENASRDIIGAGADFLKTSTGKTPTGATKPAVTAMLKAIQELAPTVGLKISGGIRTLPQVKEYYSMIIEFMGYDWVSPRTFRIGTSKLLT